MSVEVIPGIFYENDFTYFEDSTFDALERVLSDVTAIMFREYFRNPAGNPAIQQRITDAIGDTITSYTFHKDLEERGILQLLPVIQFEVMESLDRESQDVIYEKLQYLLDNEKRMRAIIPKRSNQDYHTFLARVSALSAPWEAGDVAELIQANRYLFYNPHEKDISLPTSGVLRKKNSWMMCYDTIRFDRYCQDHSIPREARFTF